MSNKFKALFLLSLLAFDSQCGRLAVAGTSNNVLGAMSLINAVILGTAVHPAKIRQAGERVKKRHAAGGFEVMPTAGASSADTDLAGSSEDDRASKGLKVMLAAVVSSGDTSRAAGKSEEDRANKGFEVVPTAVDLSGDTDLGAGISDEETAPSHASMVEKLAEFEAHVEAKEESGEVGENKIETEQFGPPEEAAAYLAKLFKMAADKFLKPQEETADGCGVLEERTKKQFPKFEGLLNDRALVTEADLGSLIDFGIVSVSKATSFATLIQQFKEKGCKEDMSDMAASLTSMLWKTKEKLNSVLQGSHESAPWMKTTADFLVAITKVPITQNMTAEDDVTLTLKTAIENMVTPETSEGRKSLERGGSDSVAALLEEDSRVSFHPLQPLVLGALIHLSLLFISWLLFRPVPNFVDYVVLFMPRRLRLRRPPTFVG